MFTPHATRYEPDPPQPTSMLIGVELAGILHNIPDYPGTITDLLSDIGEMADYITDYQPGVVADMLQRLARLLDEIRGLQA